MHIDRKAKLSVILYFMVNQSSANNYATKSDVNKIVKQSEKVLRQEILKVEEKVENLQDKVGGLEVRVGGLEEKVERVEERVISIEGKIDRIAITLDGFVGRVDDLTTENVIGTNQMRKIKISVENHEKRIKVLESS